MEQPKYSMSYLSFMRYVTHTESEERFEIFIKEDGTYYLERMEDDVAGIKPQNNLIRKKECYKHYKGDTYFTLFETTFEGEELVVYTNFDNLFWARPKDMFFSLVEKDGKMVKRFKPFTEIFKEEKENESL